MNNKSLKAIFVAILTIAMSLTFAIASFAESIVLENTTNVALGKLPDAAGNVDVPNLTDGSLWGAEYITDGVWNSATNIGWYAVASQEQCEEGLDLELFLDLEGKFTINKIVVMPMRFLNGTNFPTSYTVEVSADRGSHWTVVGEEKDLDIRCNDISELQSREYSFDAMNATDVRIFITGKSFCDFEADNNRNYIGIGELEVWGVEGFLVATPAPTDVPATDTPAPTDAPATDAPATDIPATEAPAETEAPKTSKGCGSAIVSGVALLTIAAACLVLRKKQ